LWGRCYAALLRAFPGDVRDAFGHSMTDTFEEMYRSVRVQQGYFAGVRFVLRAMMDVVVTGVAERLVRGLGRESVDDECADGVRKRMRGGEGPMFKDLQSDLRF